VLIEKFYPNKTQLGYNTVHTLWSCPSPQLDTQREAFFACPALPTQAHFLVKQPPQIETRSLTP